MASKTTSAAKNRASISFRNGSDPNSGRLKVTGAASAPNNARGTLRDPNSGSLTITGRAAGPTNASGSLAPAHPAPAPAAPAAPASVVQPFLTDAQKASLSEWNTKYSDTLAQLDESDKLAESTLTQGTANDEFANANNVDMTNQAMAARGLFQSSIRDNALNDLAVTMAQQKLALQTTHDATISNDQIQRTTLGAQNTTQQGIYNTDAVANAQSVTPTPPAAAPSATGAVHPAAPPKPPIPTGAPKTEGVTKPPVGPYAGTLQRVKSVNAPAPKLPGLLRGVRPPGL